MFEIRFVQFVLWIFNAFDIETHTVLNYVANANENSSKNAET